MTSLTQALPLYNGINNRVCHLLIEYMTNVNVWTRQVFIKAQYPYFKDDLASNQRPAIMCEPLYAKGGGFNSTEHGIVKMTLFFSFTKARGELWQNACNIADLIVLMNMRGVFTEYLADFLGGLRWFGRENTEVDYTQLSSDNPKITITFRYLVDLMGYQEWLQSFGCDITSPDEVIYQIAQGLNSGIEVLDKEFNTEFIV
jgi:hypothetical protein